MKIEPYFKEYLQQDLFYQELKAQGTPPEQLRRYREAIRETFSFAIFSNGRAWEDLFRAAADAALRTYFFIGKKLLSLVHKVRKK